MEAGTEEHGAHLTGKVSEMRAFGPILFRLAINELILAAQEE